MNWMKLFSNEINLKQPMIPLNLDVMFFVRLGPNEIEIHVMLYAMYSNESPSLYLKTHSPLTLEKQDERSQYPRMCSKRRKKCKKT